MVTEFVAGGIARALVFQGFQVGDSIDIVCESLVLFLGLDY